MYKKLSEKQFKHFSRLTKGFAKNPLFYFGVVSFVLFGLLFFGSHSLAQLSYLPAADASVSSPFFKDTKAQDSLFVGQDKDTALETPDLKIIQDEFVYGVSTPRIVSPQTLGDLFGNAPSVSNSKEVVDYTTQAGDTIDSVAQKFTISADTVRWANNLSKGASLKEGQTLSILPTSGVIHVVKSGDTIAEIAKKYQANADDIIAFNNLSNEGDIFIGDTLIIPNGILPKKSTPSLNLNIGISLPLPDSSFIFPLVHFHITQGLHYFNGVDIASNGGAGSPVYAPVEGIVQRAGYIALGGNVVTILASNGQVFYMGHLNTILAHSGEHVDIGQQIGTEGQTGLATGPHVHFQVMGGKNPLAGVPVGAEFDKGVRVK